MRARPSPTAAAYVGIDVHRAARICAAGRAARSSSRRRHARASTTRPAVRRPRRAPPPRLRRARADLPGLHEELPRSCSAAGDEPRERTRHARRARRRLGAAPRGRSRACSRRPASRSSGQAGTADDLLLKVRSYKPDVAIVDIRMPPTHTDEGLRAAKEIREQHPDVRRARALAVRRGRLRARAAPGERRGRRLPAQGPGRRRRASSRPPCGASPRAARRSTRPSSRSWSAAAAATTRSTT